MRFGLLGPTVLHDADGTPRPVGSPKVRALLAALLLEPGRVVSVEALKDALWGGAPPASAQASLQNHVTRLRRLLDDPDRLRAVPPGYRLRVEDEELDVRVFERRVSAAREAHARREWGRVAREASGALALWRGTPLSGLPTELVGRALVPRLQEARLLALEWHYDAELHVVRPDAALRLAGLVPELAALVAEHPLRESFHRQLMLVLHRTGRQAEALAVHRDLRARLVEELGIEPGPAVREAHQEILREPGRVSPPSSGGRAPGSHDGDTASRQGRTPYPDGSAAPRTTGHPPRDAPGPQAVRSPQAAGSPYADGGPHADGSPQAARSPQAAGSPHTGGSPHADGGPTGDAAPLAQLPPAPAHFTGRGDLPAKLRRALDTPTAVAVISGMAGVGKSALALHVAHGLRDRFPDGQLYVNLHGATPGMAPLTPGQALATLLRDLGTDPRRIPEHPDAAAALLRSLLAPTRTLMVLDDAATAAQVRPLQPAGAGCAVIVTSRSPLTALDGAHRFPLAPLSDDESAALLRAVSGRDGLDGAHPLVELTGRLPLALRIVAARLAARRALTPDALAGQLAATGGRLHHLEYDDLSVRRSLAVALDALRSSARPADRDAARVLSRIGALDLPGYGAPLLARLTGTDERRAEAALDRLVDVALLEETAYGRYAPHDLVRDFAREIATAVSPGGADPDGPDAPGPASVVRTALHWYADSARQSMLAIQSPGHERDERLRTVRAALDRDPTPASAAPFASAEDAFAWGDRELENIVALVETCASAWDRDGSPAACVLVPALVRCLFPYLQRTGRLGELDVLGRIALQAARALGDAAAEAFALTDRAGLHFMSGRVTEALALNDEGLALWRRLGVAPCVRNCLNNRGLLLEGLGRYAESEAALRQSLELSRSLGDQYGEAVTFSHLGNLYEHTDARTAIAHHERSLALGEVVGSDLVRQTAHCNIGFARLTLGEPAAAVDSFEESLRLLDSHEDWQGESQTRLGLVRALRGLGRAQRAGQECAVLLERAEHRADRYMSGLARHQRGLLLHADGRPHAARDQWTAALAELDATDSPVVKELRGLLAGQERRDGADEQDGGAEQDGTDGQDAADGREAADGQGGTDGQNGAAD